MTITFFTALLSWKRTKQEKKFPIMLRGCYFITKVNDLSCSVYFKNGECLLSKVNDLSCSVYFKNGKCLLSKDSLHQNCPKRASCPKNVSQKFSFESVHEYSM